ncbi:MAG: Hypothetical protein DUF2419 [uncultured Solirubrobacteraceae bacterium]|uniref:Queuosine 5'-phosphate N-glycosylase/hydrolase n=1 Tax=uncultured Solirubrobacteraceae bacterium TaxID=1162706 RepID=A0A6J4RW64_9ACTN|nr:MAG: Hypothetical protein DUF2419 [uncultured Solirubrobacteraceae bacterium]
MPLERPGTPVYDQVRRHCAEVAERARWVAIDPSALRDTGSREGLDSDLHFLDGDEEEVARYVLVLDTVNFGSGWFPTLDLPAGQSGTVAVTRALTEHARARGSTWTPAELRALTGPAVAAVLGQPASHPLMALYAAALAQLGAWLDDRSALAAVEAARGSADAFARSLAAGMPFFDDVGFHKRAQIAANDLVHAGVAAFEDIDALTIFADNLVPHVLRGDGVLVYAPELASRVDAGILLEPGSAMEVEIRACAVHACELIAHDRGVAPRTLDNWLWNRGEDEASPGSRPHLTRTVFY